MKRILRIMMLLAAMIITVGQPAWAKDITINLGEGRGTVTFSEASLEFSKCEALEVGFSFDIPLEVMTQSKTYGGVVMQNYTATLDNGVTIDGTLTGEIAAAASQTYTYTVTNNEMTRRPVSVSMTRGDSNDNDPTVEIATWSGFRKGACSFTFDDGAPSHVSDAGPVFKKYGYKATFNLVVNWNPNWSGFQGLADEGHEIASHSNSHGQNMSGEEASSKNNIKGKISQKYGVITVAYPNCNVPSESAVLQNYIVGRICNGSWQGMADNMGKDGPSNWAKVPAIMTGSEGQLKSTNDFTSQMQKVVQSNGWVAFLTHGFQGKNNGSATYSPTDLNAIDGALKWAQQNDKDIWVAPMGHVAMYIKERKASKVEVKASTASSMTIQLKHTIADNISKYDYPLSLRLKSNWEKVEVTQGDNKLKSKIDGGYIYFDAIPNGGDIVVINEDASKINYEHHAGDGGLLICYANADDASADNWGNTIKCVQDANNHDKYTYYPTSSTLTDGIVYIVAQPDFGYTGLGATITAEKTTGSGNAQARLRAPGVGQTIAVTAVSGHPGVYQFTMPTDGSNVTLSAKFNTLSTNTADINYLDEKGASKTKNKGTVYVLDGTEYNLGVANGETWYVANGELSYGHTLSLYGDVHLILADGAKMNVTTVNDYDAITYGSGTIATTLSIYAQSKDSSMGSLSAACTYPGNIPFGNGNGIEAGSITINGGTVKAEGYNGINANGILSITGGTVEAIGISNGIWANGDITISGGQVKATGGTGSYAGIYSGGGTIHLGYTDADDYIFASSYSGTVKVANGKVFQYTDDDTVYKLFPGTLDAEQKTAIGGKKLTALMVSSFAQLNTLINESTATTITLDKDYTYIGGDDEVYKDGIVINRDLTIIGDEHTIDGRSIARIFHVTDDATLTIKKAVLTEGYAEKGGGIFVDEGATLNADYVNFTDNTAVYRGGAIYSEGTVIVDHSVFDKNDITFRTKNDDNGGAAIYNMKGSLTITNTDITNNVKNIVPRDGNAGDLLVGVVATCGETSITDSQFTKNAGAWGGAISSLGYMNDDAYTLTVTNTKFEENSANFGSAIFVESSELVVDNCTFEYNCCVGKGSSGSPNTQGGAIIVYPNSDPTISNSSKTTITNSTFNKNSANIGGAVSLAGVDRSSLIDNCTFTENTASSEGGALYLWTQSDAVVTVSNSEFSDNTSPWGNAISNDGELELSNNTVSSTSADIANYYGSILSKINVDILENKTIDFYGEILITAKVTDDNKNLIKDINFDYDIKGTTGSSETVHAVFESGLYKGTFTTDVPDVYVVNMTYPVTDNLVVKTATLRNMRGDETAILFAENTTNLWATFCDIYERNLPEGCTAYTVSSVSGTTVNLSEALATIPAYTPVLIKRSTAGADAVTAAYSAPGTVPASDYDDETGIVTFAATGGTVYGNAGKTAVTDSEANHFISDQTYVLFNGKFVKVGTNSGLAAHRLWLNVSSAAARELIIGDDATGIASMDDAGSQNADGWYSLDGRKLDKAPKKKGVYVNSGRKVVIK